MTADRDSTVDPHDAAPPNAGPSDLVVRLRERAAQLRAQSPERQTGHEPTAPDPESGLTDPEPGPEQVPEAEQELEQEPEPTPPPHAAGIADHDLLEQWSSEAHFEAVSPRRNWAPLIALLVVAAAGALVYVVFRTLVADGDTASPAERRGEDAEASTVLDEEPPSLDELTADVTIPPGPAEGLSVVEQGIAVVEDRFDPERREGTFAVVIANPHAGWLAQSVQVDVIFLDEAGGALGADTAFVEVVLPGQTVAVASHFFDAPAAPVAGLDVDIDVARWRETQPFEGTFVVTEVVTEEAEFSGVRTSAMLRSTFDRPLRDVGVTVVYRGAFGQIVGGYDTFLDLLEPGVDTPVEIALLANIPLDQITSTEVYAHAGFGFVPDDG